ncbi:hypothetical protein FVA95_26605 [Pseudonocardia sp. EV170527-09]|uniref:hypothetical protein n=1 Tax=Pseudonocardia sp. EV170527-09 TaxID=2603411 RepID=UPI0011F20AF7|nr:hypothetical protein [Pseudonocardia sp. EV170527-09]KAA1013942.1 hypothetical protein FVA95_26605 [Pseudonocardia sp. EV170527-09]
MSRAYPYRRPPGDVVTIGPWLRLTGDSVDELPLDLPDWDYGTVLHLKRPMRVDGLRAREACGLSAGSAVTLTVVWAAANSSLRGQAWQGPVPAVDGAELEIDFELPGDELGGRLDLETSLILQAADAGSSATAPSRPGSVLWREVHSVMLQGDAVLFPLAVVDFEQVRYPSGAAWHLELSEDLDSQALGSILLLANKRRPVVTSALENAADPTEADRLVLSTVQSEVVRSLVERAVVDDEFDPANDYAAGTVGALLTSVLVATFPERDLDALRRERKHEPILFTTRIQNATGLLAST